MNDLLGQIIDYIDNLGDNCNWFYNFNNKFFEDELKRELNNKHILFNRRYQAILKSECNDDIIYLLDDDCFVDVHLTFQVESTDKFPRYRIIEDLKELKEYISKQY